MINLRDIFPNKPKDEDKRSTEVLVPCLYYSLATYVLCAICGAAQVGIVHLAGSTKISKYEEDWLPRSTACAAYFAIFPQISVVVYVACLPLRYGRLEKTSMLSLPDSLDYCTKGAHFNQT